MTDSLTDQQFCIEQSEMKGAKQLEMIAYRGKNSHISDLTERYIYTIKMNEEQKMC